MSPNIAAQNNCCSGSGSRLSRGYSQSVSQAEVFEDSTGLKYRPPASLLCLLAGGFSSKPRRSLPRAAHDMSSSRVNDTAEKQKEGTSETKSQLFIT